MYCVDGSWKFHSLGAFQSSLIMSDAFSAIIITGAFVFPLTILGIIEASTTRSLDTSCTLRRGSTTAISSNLDPILQVPTGWYIVVVYCMATQAQYLSLPNSCWRQFSTGTSTIEAPISCMAFVSIRLAPICMPAGKTKFCRSVMVKLLVIIIERGGAMLYLDLAHEVHPSEVCHYYASIRSLSLRLAFSGCFFYIGSAISRYGTTIEQHYSRRKWGEGGRKEHKTEMR